MKLRVLGEKEMEDFAANYVAGITPFESRATVVALSGPLGAGKTTFVRGVLRSYGIEEPVTSPTFVIEKVYIPPRGPFKKIVHIDAYRLENTHELDVLGFKELLGDEGTLILIEWPEHVEGAMPPDARRLAFTIGEGEERFVEYNS
ncbi:tRNA (adenosine(37)-N6)-threonylcarbamoyltransferase complex ATPase subunit type 1 TsaE [Candidatus Kaiserbacteria bacterium RIFCSPHIGHO2_01_FULL_50_13]|uniref:tRNA threonylcarbamoyladenosine biosynthesis protein TsaE n=1 Tax=Candidatus Kaiserbacteria bacterium RIFCSPLOWO2_01_FULL_50_24 TaxID=1798507 RepID=A0A1F6ERB8_9BACT|nr:MAG: tRNA (adenosine(37)-N6)-threonylcarbamoyltransferase complex ATPase subunit type 1 TsaE [Candidatus Kaiserbacteria bacterium RIFCSPHIGHO2_01_FULL_50_13]OGG76154.1 MAG: tRNA (adenosine(37)-N6)-threonylcarbamoyltransferase complex ATPase subunit type 1 TsaE [Candidatus Kaiserbacteria bacterium RIFCSPLOWO2_01_FULL_50_24]OGG81169.1 MAG: tRNA (adenosine(37)-N6)-threonylcarbamoyltransferase complex ATPase subunit type 1 TsaE [Candidatus Kaiserbacteria bacterium RIFCSPLOWO2_02_FULL_51_13]